MLSKKKNSIGKLNISVSSKNNDVAARLVFEEFVFCLFLNTLNIVIKTITKMALITKYALYALKLMLIIIFSHDAKLSRRVSGRLKLYRYINN